MHILLKGLQTQKKEYTIIVLEWWIKHRHYISWLLSQLDQVLLLDYQEIYEFYISKPEGLGFCFLSLRIYKISLRCTEILKGHLLPSRYLRIMGPFYMIRYLSFFIVFSLSFNNQIQCNSSESPWNQLNTASILSSGSRFEECSMRSQKFCGFFRGEKIQE